MLTLNTISYLFETGLLGDWSAHGCLGDLDGLAHGDLVLHQSGGGRQSGWGWGRGLDVDRVGGDLGLLVGEVFLGLFSVCSYCKEYKQSHISNFVSE